MAASAQIQAWSPSVPGVAEVLHAHFTDHAYPLHTHDTWTVLVVDSGAVTYDLDRGEHGALRPTVTLLPPHVPHNGRAATGDGFRKRVLYLDGDLLDGGLIGRAVDHPAVADPALREHIGGLHGALERPGDELEAESRLALVRERLEEHLRHTPPAPPPRPRTVSHALRDLLDAHVRPGLSLAEASAVLGTDSAHLVRAFSHEFGVPPHRYLNGRRLDHARRLLLAGRPASEVAQEVASSTRRTSRGTSGGCSESHPARSRAAVPLREQPFRSRSGYRRHALWHVNSAVGRLLPCPT